MISDKIFDELLELVVVVVDGETLLGGEHHVFDGFHLCGRTGHTDLSGVGVDKCGAPLLDVEVGTSIDKSLLLR